MCGLPHLILTAILWNLPDLIFLVRKLRHREVTQLIGGRARILSHEIYLQSISCHSVADRIRMNAFSPGCRPEGAPLEVSVICLGLYCLCRDHYKGIGFPNAFWVVDSVGSPTFRLHYSSSSPLMAGCLAKNSWVAMIQLGAAQLCCLDDHP